jgi:methyl-accepting chemotaxis protein
MIASIQQMTAEAIRSMRSGTEKVEAGVHTAERAGDALQRIMDEAEAQNLLMAQIAGASSQQAAMTNQVKANMEEILRMAEHSVSNAGESARECSALSSLALELQSLLGRFQTEERAA